MSHFITIEGIEGVGKSTAVEFIREALTEKKIDFIVTREPGGTSLAEKIRALFLSVPHAVEAMQPDTELLLVFAARVQHVHEVIQPALDQGKWVICDRFTDASFAYQGAGRGIEWDRIRYLEKWLLPHLSPDLTFLLHAPVSVGMSRAKHRGPQDRIEKEKKDFFERVQEGYFSRLKAEPHRFFSIDATQSIESVQANIQAVLDRLSQ